MTIMAGGFGLCGIPEHLIAAIAQKAPVTSSSSPNNCGVDDFDFGILLASEQIE
jgi:3-oxoacid CoA-transferase subunit A